MTTPACEVIVVDDVSANLHLLSEVLQREGLVVRQATDGVLALRSIRAKKPDMVLLDVRMPGLDGYEVCRQLKADPATAGIPVLFVTALDDPDALARGFAVGAADYICKPICVPEVLARVRAQLEIRRLRLELEARVEEGTREQVRGREEMRELLAEAKRGRLALLSILEDQRTAEKALRETNDELTRFSYTVSHDLKSPLVTLRSFLGFLEKDLAAGDQVRVAADLQFLRSAAEKMGLLLEGVLELSRVGRKMNPPSDLPLDALVDEVLELLAGPLAQRRVEVKRPARNVTLRGDRLRLREVFQNLVENAVKFMGDQPAPLIEVGVEAAAGGDVFFVRDNGVGIDPRHKDKLFGLFEKLDPKSEGSGLGLALVKRIVEFHGGRVWAESDGPGTGTTFKFTLPTVQP